MPTQAEKKDIEKRYILAAKEASNLIPDGTLEPREEPDFTLLTESGLIGIEVVELTRPADLPGKFAPVEVEDFHKDVIELAESFYYKDTAATPATVQVYFSDTKGKTHKDELARSLAETVKSNIHRTDSTLVLSRGELPNGIFAMSIWQEGRTWTSGEHGGTNLDQIKRQVEKTIAYKEMLIPTYRRNLPDSSIWLFMYTGIQVSRGFEFPSNRVDLSSSFTFDKVFWYSSLDNDVIEILRSASDSMP